MDPACMSHLLLKLGTELVSELVFQFLQMLEKKF